MDRKTELYKKIDHHLMNDPKPSYFFNDLIDDDTFATQTPFTFISDLINTPQSPKYHPEGSVWNHTMMVVDSAAKRKGESDDYKTFMWAALLHDIGKAPTTKIRKDKITSYDHEKAGAELASEFLSSFENDAEFIEKVCLLIRWHMQVLFAVNKSSFAEIDKMKSQVPIKEIALLGLCDRLGRKGASKEVELRNINEFINVCGEGQFYEQ